MQADFANFKVRNLYPWDAEQVFENLTGRTDVTKYLGFRTHTTVHEAAALVGRYIESPSKYLAICPQNDPSDILGIAGFEIMSFQATMLIMIRSDKRARGVGRLFGAPFTQWIMSHPNIYRLWSYVHVDNIAGQRVAERCGAVREGRLRRYARFPNISDEPQDVYSYAITR